MKISNIKTMKKGWFIGNFSPSVYKTDKFEVAVHKHKKDEKWDKHYHKEAIEINLLLEGKMLMNNIEIEKDDIFLMEKNEVANPVFLTDCTIVVVKVPSVKGDKYVL